MSSSSFQTPPIVASPSHAVMFHLPMDQNGPPKPPEMDTDPWCKSVVEMPNSTNNTKMWKIICEQYKRPLQNFEELRKTILSYNNYTAEDGSFTGLKEYIENKLNRQDQKEFFEDLLPKIICLALSLPQEVTQPVPLLEKRSSLSVSLSQKQIGVLLANAFLCTFPLRNASGEKCGYGDYPDINFNRLFLRKDPHTQHKFECIFSYFKRITTAEPDGVVTFTRQSFSTFPDFSSSVKPLPVLNLKIDGVIEKAENHLQVDFADKYIGGLIFTKGCVQEEIRFLLCPELIVSRLFTAVLQDNEALMVTGVEQYNEGKGYGKSFHFASSFHDTSPRDEFRRRRCQLVAIDALRFSGRINEQYEAQHMLREIKKAFAGFCPLRGTTGPLTPVASGNWGCGVFRGNARLKSLLQLIAAGEAGRDLTYFSFGNKNLISSLGSLYDFLREKNVTIGQLTSILLSYGEEKAKLNAMDMYGYIRQQVDRSLYMHPLQFVEAE